MGNQYYLTPKGDSFIHNPRRNRDGHIGTDYYRSLILIYIFVINPKYRPSVFKEYVESLNILNDKDWEYMNTSNYKIWKHHIDAAKQGLLPFMGQNQDGTFFIEEPNFNSLFKEIMNYVALSEQDKPEYPEESTVSPNRVPTTILRIVRDTILTNRVKEERGYKCQVCGTQLIIKEKGYAEAHHVKPLGHDGPDIEDNLLVLCPNHHVLFDYGAIGFSPEDYKTVIDNQGNSIFVLTPPFLKMEYIEYHNNKIFVKLFK